MCDQEYLEEVEEAAAVPCCATSWERDQDTEKGKPRPSAKTSICEQKHIFLPAFSVLFPTIVSVFTSALTPQVGFMALSCSKCLDLSAHWVSNSVVFCRYLP